MIYVASLRFGEKLAQPRAREEVVACSAIIDVTDARLVDVAHPLDQLLAAFELYIEAELLLAFVVLRASAVSANGHDRRDRDDILAARPRPARLVLGHRGFDRLKVG